MIRIQSARLASVLRPHAVFSLALLAVLTSARIGLVVWQFDRVTAANMLVPVMIEGLRFDLIVLGFFLVFPVLALPIFATSRRMLRVGGRVLVVYLVACFVSAVFLEVATPSFISQFDSRPNRLFVEYLVYPKEVGSTLITAYGYQLGAAALAVFAGAIWLSRELSGRAASMRPMNILAALVATPLLFVVCVAAMRSTLDHRAVNPSTVAISTDPMVNDLALNSTYSLLYAVVEEQSEPEGGFRYASMPFEEVVDRVKRGMHIEDTAYASSELPTLHVQRPPAPPSRKKNLVIVLEESLGAEFVGALGGLPLTPELDALSTQGIWFENLYATGTRSVRGLEALITGFTPTPARSVVKLGRSQRHFFTIAELLREQGYATSFIYGGESQFDNMRRFFMNNGFDTVIDEKDYDAPIFHGSWGVSDEDLLTRADQTFTDFGDQPFFALVFTTSNHSPYDYPAGRIELYDPDPATVNNAVKYADHALGQFFATAAKRDYWDDTVFLVVADHNSRVYGSDLIPIEHFHIPGLILGGGVEPAVFEPIASQIDLPPTLLSMIGITSVHPMIGHDLTRPEFADATGRAILQYGATQGYMQGQDVVILRKDLPPVTYTYDGRELSPAPAKDDLVRTAIAHADWASTAYEQALYGLPAQSSLDRQLSGPRALAGLHTTSGASTNR